MAMIRLSPFAFGLILGVVVVTTAFVTRSYYKAKTEYSGQYN